MPNFADYKPEGSNWITLATGEFYPDILVDACNLYKPVLEIFAQLLKSSESSERLFLATTEIKQGWMRIQLARVFRKYVSPNTPVEMLKVKSKAKEICSKFGKGFRPIPEVQRAFLTRPLPDEALCAILWEYRERGSKGYDLTERMFDQFRSMFPQYTMTGPERAGRDIILSEVFEDYPNKNRPADFVIKNGEEILAVGFARYDSDRGGAQEDDRTGGYKNCADEVIGYAQSKGLKTKVIFINDGPGLLLGSMWRDYSQLEDRHTNIMVLTLRMIPVRLTEQWLNS